MRYKNAIKARRTLLGPTNSDKARELAPQSIRAEFGTDGQKNAGHGSDSVYSAARELEFFFPSVPVLPPFLHSRPPTLLPSSVHSC